MSHAKLTREECIRTAWSIPDGDLETSTEITAKHDLLYLVAEVERLREAIASAMTSLEAHEPRLDGYAYAVLDEATKSPVGGNS